MLFRLFCFSAGAAKQANNKKKFEDTEEQRIKVIS